MKEDIAELDQKTKARIRKAIEDRLVKAPDAYGRPLKRELKGYYRLRVGDYRIVYRIFKERKEVLVLAILHRNRVYEEILKKDIFFFFSGRLPLFLIPKDGFSGFVWFGQDLEK